MVKGYWIARVDVQDPDQYDKYRAVVADPLKPFNGRFLVRAGSQEVREGVSRARTIIIEFPSYQDAVSCYESPAYQAVKELRLGAAEIDLLIVEGIAP